MIRYQIYPKMVTNKQELISGMSKYNTPERKIEYLEVEIRKGLTPEMKKEALILIAQLYESKKWWGNAAKNYQIASDLAVLIPEKMNILYKTAEMYLRAEDYFSSDDYFRRAMAQASMRERAEMQRKIFAMYLSLAQEYESKKNNTKAIQVYNRLLSLPGYPFDESQKIRDKLVILYDKIGKPFEANQLRNQKANQQAMLEKQKEESKQKLEEAKRQRAGEGFYEVDFD